LRSHRARKFFERRPRVIVDGLPELKNGGY
jgi:hypothetical protein